MERPPLLTNARRKEIIDNHIANSPDLHTAGQGLGQEMLEAQRDADVDWFVNWQVHEVASQLKRRREAMREVASKIIEQIERELEMLYRQYDGMGEPTESDALAVSKVYLLSSSRWQTLKHRVMSTIEEIGQ